MNRTKIIDKYKKSIHNKCNKNNTLVYYIDKLKIGLWCDICNETFELTMNEREIKNE